MATIDVKKSDQGDRYEFQVTVKDRGGETHHRVTLRKADYERLAGGKATPEALVTESLTHVHQAGTGSVSIGCADREGNWASTSRYHHH